jgi:hypothetical protein
MTVRHVSAADSERPGKVSDPCTSFSSAFGFESSHRRISLGEDRQFLVICRSVSASSTFASLVRCTLCQIMVRPTYQNQQPVLCRPCCP